MTVSIANMTMEWANANGTYVGVGMDINSNTNVSSNSRVLRFRINGNTIFDVDANGTIYSLKGITTPNVDAVSTTSTNINTNNLTSNIIKSQVYTVNSLPNAINIGIGSRAFVSDANSNVFMNKAYANGNNAVPVFSNGKYWLIG